MWSWRTPAAGRGGVKPDRGACPACDACRRQYGRKAGGKWTRRGQDWLVGCCVRPNDARHARGWELPVARGLAVLQRKHCLHKAENEMHRVRGEREHCSATDWRRCGVSCKSTRARGQQRRESMAIPEPWWWLWMPYIMYLVVDGRRIIALAGLRQPESVLEFLRMFGK